jgi:hypothetical protein
MDMPALVLGAEFRDVDAGGAIATLDVLDAELSRAVAQTSGTPDELALVWDCVAGDHDAFRPPRCVCEQRSSRRR